MSLAEDLGRVIPEENSLDLTGLAVWISALQLHATSAADEILIPFRRRLGPVEMTGAVHVSSEGRFLRVWGEVRWSGILVRQFSLVDGQPLHFVVVIPGPTPSTISITLAWCTRERRQSVISVTSDADERVSAVLVEWDPARA
jgi:hypothetical protein